MVWCSREWVLPALTLSRFSSEPFRLRWASGIPKGEVPTTEPTHVCKVASLPLRAAHGTRFGTAGPEPGSTLLWRFLPSLLPPDSCPCLCPRLDGGPVCPPGSRSLRPSGPRAQSWTNVSLSNIPASCCPVPRSISTSPWVVSQEPGVQRPFGLSGEQTPGQGALKPLPRVCSSTQQRVPPRTALGRPQDAWG